MSKKRPTLQRTARPENERDPLEEIRRAALELRGTDPAEAVKVLRRVLKMPGEFAPLAHGALAEILLDDFQDGDGAAHHFAEFVKVAPKVSAGHVGLARARAAAGDPDGSHAAYVSAVGVLSAAIDSGLTRLAETNEEVPDEEPFTLDADTTTLLEAAAEDRALRAEEHRDWAVITVDDALLARVEAARAFDDEADSEELSEWAGYALLRASLATLDGGLPAGLATVDRLAAFVPFPEWIVAELQSQLYEASGDAERAAETALKSLGTEEAVDPIASLRAAALLVTVDRKADANALLERAIKAVDKARTEPDLPDEVKEELAAVREELRKNLGELAAPGLVGLGTKKKK